MQSISASYNPYSDARRADISFAFGVVAPTAAETAQPSSTLQSEVSQIEQTIDGVREMSGKYTSLETNMWVLDGTMEVYPGEQTGWQSEHMSDDNKAFSSNPWLEFEFSQSQNSYGFTLIFDDTQPFNYPTQIITTAYAEDGSLLGTLTTYPDGYRHVINLPIQLYRRVRFEFAGTNIPHRRVRVCCAIFGVEYIYDKSNIVSVDVRQSISPWAESLPSAEFQVTIDNSSRIYNMVNPDGLYEYLQEGQFMDWQIIINEEPVKMGRQYFTSAQSEDGGLTASITFNDRIFALDDIEYEGDEDEELVTWMLSEAVNELLLLSGTGISAVFEGQLGQSLIWQSIPRKTSVREALRLCAQAAMCTCCIDRNNQLHFFTPQISDEPADIWSMDVQYPGAQIKVGEYYNSVKLTVENGETDVFGNPIVYKASNIAEGDFERLYEVSNPLVVDGDAVAQWILQWVQRRVSYEVELRGNPALDLLDLVQINDIYGVNSTAVITKLDYSYDGGLKCDGEAIR